MQDFKIREEESFKEIDIFIQFDLLFNATILDV